MTKSVKHHGNTQLHAGQSIAGVQGANVQERYEAKETNTDIKFIQKKYVHSHALMWFLQINQEIVIFRP